MGGWVGGVEENEAVGMRCCMLGLGVGGWVGGWVSLTFSSSSATSPLALSMSIRHLGIEVYLNGWVGG